MQGEGGRRREGRKLADWKAVKGGGQTPRSGLGGCMSSSQDGRGGAGLGTLGKQASSWTGT